MHLEHFEFHNIAELDTTSAYPGSLIRRIPQAVAEALENGALEAEDVALSEVRFVVESNLTPSSLRNFTFSTK